MGIEENESPNGSVKMAVELIKAEQANRKWQTIFSLAAIEGLLPDTGARLMTLKIALRFCEGSYILSSVSACNFRKAPEHPPAFERVRL
ncbi:hypothetical protein CEXT_114071 [Caerostris extrusa]|uniref:Uncharacterized protein n=1 Tax=Caerostris extrusa TaxID=172846 RepID=A0AAV4RDF5_CAEEX|nr:hypothetical protein CEXT_114071 [Caerostris extrusa]